MPVINDQAKLFFKKATQLFFTLAST